MNLKKFFVTLFSVSMLFTPQISSAADQIPDLTKNQKFDQTKSDGYVYTSKRYQYQITCPKMPQVIPVSMMYENHHGDILIFDYENDDVMQIHTAWVVITDPFENDEVIDFNKANKTDFENYLEALKKNNAFDSAVKLQLPKKNTGVLAVTAKTLDIDTDGDGIFETQAVADHQEIVVYFRTLKKNNPISVQLLAFPEVSKDVFDAFKIGIATFEDLS